MLLQILTKFSKFRQKNAIFRTSFQTRPLNPYLLFRPGLKAEIMLSLLRLERKQKNSSSLFQIRIFLLLSYSFGIETINTFIYSRSSLENHTRFQTKMGKVYTRFQTKTVQKPYTMGRPPRGVLNTFLILELFIFVNAVHD